MEKRKGKYDRQKDVNGSDYFPPTQQLKENGQTNCNHSHNSWWVLSFLKHSGMVPILGFCKNELNSNQLAIGYKSNHCSLFPFFLSSKEPRDPDQLYSTLKSILQQVKVGVLFIHLMQIF